MSSRSKTHLLIIGGTGFIGYHLALSAKKKGWRISSVSLRKPKIYRHVNGVKYLKADITKLNKLRKKLKGNFTYVVNLGGYVDHSNLANKRNKIIRDHFVGLINLTKVLFGKKIKKFIQIGSSVEYGISKAPQKELSSCITKSNYASSKLASTHFLQMLYYVYNFPVTILRFFQVYGPNQDQNRILPQIINGCLKNKKFPVSKGDQIRDFCYIDDVIKAIFSSLSSRKTNGEIFNIGSGHPIKIKNVIKIICKLIGRGKPQFGKIKYRKDENMKLYPNIKKAKNNLKWRPKTNFKTGIRLTIKYFENK